MTSEQKSKYAAGLIDFLKSSPTQYHAVETIESMLKRKHFRHMKLSETSPSEELQASQRLYFTKNGSTIVAFKFPKQTIDISKANFRVIATHTDSCGLRLRPKSTARNNDGYKKLAVEAYGGGLWHTWFDRDLSLAGRATVDSLSGNKPVEALVDFKRPFARIPSLAIHLNRGSGNDFQFNNETHLFPIIALKKGDKSAETKDTYQEIYNEVEQQIWSRGPEFQEYRVSDLDLILYDSQEPQILGSQGEFVVSQRLDNLGMTYCAVESYLQSDNVQRDDVINVLVCFDHEEVGSVSAQGAQSNFICSALRRALMYQGYESSVEFESVLARSTLISADMAHAVHPNYGEKHDENHRPKLNEGLVVKINANQRYMTNSRGKLLMKFLADEARAEIQDFVVRNDSPCGSTIGPALAAHTGMLTIDVGNPMLSMHSIREMAGVDDIESAIRIFEKFYNLDSLITDYITCSE